MNAWRSSDVIFRYRSIQQGTVSDLTGYSPGHNRVQSDNQQGTVGKLIVVMTGSDLFPFDGVLKDETLQSIRLADAVVITQGEAREKLDHPLVKEIRKSIAIPEEVLSHQKAVSPGITGLIVAHVREQKNPFLYLRAIPYLKNSLLIKHYGDARSEENRDHAEKYKSEFYQWMGVIPRIDLLKELKNADFLLNTSYIEGSSNAICEALVLGTPVIASAIPGNTGVLGRHYPGLFRADDAESLADILDKFIESESFRQLLKEYGSELAQGFDPAREQRDWCDLLAELQS